MEQNNILYIEIGKQLANKREELNITISEAYKALRIRDRYLRAIESGTIDQIPSGIYRAGYIKSYAQFLNLNIDLYECKASIMAPECLDVASRNIRAKLSSPSKLVVWVSIFIVILINILLYCIK